MSRAFSFTSSSSCQLLIVKTENGIGGGGSKRKSAVASVLLGKPVFNTKSPAIGDLMTISTLIHLNANIGPTVHAYFIITWVGDEAGITILGFGNGEHDRKVRF